ncbi:MAG: ABC transporter ATP-binding protein, partial [Candidatus Methanomethylophilaceae archaeon]|nr:ABC transporter ATP-binding protein [Candidatus Methanomethylophilaceae archaeon]
MDEPTAGLDPQMALELMELAEQLHNRGTTIVISTHDVDLAYAWADEIHVLKRGKLIYSGSSEDFYRNPAEVHSTGVMQPSMFVMNENLSAMRGTDPSPYPRTESQLVSKMVSGPKGRLTLVAVKSAADCNIERFAGGTKTGVYGTAVRRLVRDAGIKTDFGFNGFESCIRECLAGRDSVLLCDEDCIGLAESKIRDLSAFGSDIKYTISGPDGSRRSS